MTREEAIEWIENIKEKYIRGGDEELDEKRKTALDMAIKALEQEPKTENDTITIPTNVLKFRGNGIVAYNVEWLKKHWKMEMHLVCGARMESEI